MFKGKAKISRAEADYSIATLAALCSVFNRTDLIRYLHNSYDILNCKG